MEIKQFQLSTRARHLRYVFFIDHKYPYEKLFELICLNQGIWGGRHNPIIPVKDNSISENYISLLSNYDPDYIYYSENIDSEIIKKLRVFNPIGYFNLDEKPIKQDISGVNTNYLLSLFDSNINIILPGELWKSDSKLLDFYKVNFGLNKNLYAIDHEIAKHYKTTIIDSENIKSLNKILHQEKPIIKSGLSRKNLNTKVLRNLEFAQYDDFELVVAKDKSSNIDILYYWNRLQYQGLNIIYLTIEELDLLSTDKFFGAVLHDLSYKSAISVVSLTLTKDEIENLISEKLNPIAFSRSFRYKKIKDFPFDILDANGLYQRDYGETLTTQTLISNNGIFYLPKLSFTNKVDFYSQSWAIDIEIKKFGGSSTQNDIKFPITTETQYIVKGAKGRVNRTRNLSIIINNQLNISDTLEIKIPEFGDLLSQLIRSPIVHGEVSNTKFIAFSLHDSSNKLSAFLKSFYFDFNTIEDFFTDKFWVDLFEELITNDRAAGDSITFTEIKGRCIVALKRKKIELGRKEETRHNEENLILGLKETLRELCNYRLFLKGFNLKCENCSSEFWYPIKEVSESITCKGCLKEFELKIESPFAYKINDLIKNNIFQSKTSRDGNLAVIRTLANIHSMSHYSFMFSPQVNLHVNLDNMKAYTDIDIVCLSEGKLIIGEAKHNSSAFFDKNKEGLNSLDKIVEISKEILPDKIVLSCYENPSKKLEKAKKTLEGKFYQYNYAPEIEILFLHQPDDFNLGEHRYFYY